MKPYRSIAALATIALATAHLCATAAADAPSVYRTVDENGNVVFTDDPRGRAAEPVELGDTTIIRSDTPAPSPAPRAGDSERPEASEALPAPQLTLTAPAPEATIRSNSGDVLIVARLDGELRAGDALEVLVDGAALARNYSGRFALSGIDRGQHRVEVRLVDAAGATVRRTAQHVFYVHQASRRAP